MSYKKKKIKQRRLGRLKYKVRQIGRALLARVKVLLQFKRRKPMRLPQVITLMEYLRTQNKMVRVNNKKIEQWVDEYINDCVVNGRPVEILSQWCVAKDLEKRIKAQGGEFSPVLGEVELIERTIPKFVQFFTKQGIKVNWWITLNRSLIDTGRVLPEVERKYQLMLESLIASSPAAENIILLNWEDEILGGRPKPAQEVLQNISKFVSPAAFEIDFVRHAAWVRDDSGLGLSDAEIRKDLEFKIACEAEEGRFLMSPESPFPNGQFLLATLEQAERYVFFTALAPKFPERLLAILKPNPWRLST
jgi:hypothetical protein